MRKLEDELEALRIEGYEKMMKASH